MTGVPVRVTSNGKILDMFPITIRKAMTTGKGGLVMCERGHAKDSRTPSPPSTSKEGMPKIPHSRLIRSYQVRVKTAFSDHIHQPKSGFLLSSDIISRFSAYPTGLTMCRGQRCTGLPDAAYLDCLTPATFWRSTPVPPMHCAAVPYVSTYALKSAPTRNSIIISTI